MSFDLFKGIVVVIDDELGNPEANITKICEQIAQSGAHWISLKALPEEGADFAHYVGVAYFVLDWELHGAAELGVDVIDGVKLPAHLKKKHLREKLVFLKKLKEHCYAPVFIFTNDGNLDTVKSALATDKDVYVPGEASHILVMSKDQVIAETIPKVLTEWVEKTPSALALLTWEREYQKAKNAAFLEFYLKSPYWPALLCRVYKEDNLDASDELGRTIARIIASRMRPFQLDLTRFDSVLDQRFRESRGAYEKALGAVLEAERFIRKDGLHADSIAPGDVFKKGGKFWVNIRPDCDCILRGADADLELYLLEGEKAPRSWLARTNPTYGTLPERDTEAAVFGMIEGTTVVFHFKDLHVVKWSEWNSKRIGRLLSPFITRIQQRYSAYLQRPGLPRVPGLLLPEPSAQPLAVVTDCAQTPDEPSPEAAPKAAMEKVRAVSATSAMRGQNSQEAAAPAAKSARRPRRAGPKHWSIKTLAKRLLSRRKPAKDD